MEVMSPTRLATWKTGEGCRPDVPASHGAVRDLDGLNIKQRSQEQVLTLGRFRLLSTQRMLMEGERPIRIGSRALDILFALVERPGQLVDKDELIARVWPNVVVEEATLRVHIAALRRILGDGEYVQNVAGQGYRFVAPVTRHEADERPQSAPAAAADHCRNLPAPLARMIGRADIVATLAVRLRQQRFITIVGPGGIGKTAVALSVADKLSQSHPCDACFVDLASVTDPLLVPSALASTLGLAILSQDPLPGLIAFVRDRTLLIVLDNCEHVVEAAAALADNVLREAPGVLLLATSREPLGSEGERVHRLAPLEAPRPSTTLTVAEALAFPAIELFAERAMASLDTFELEDADVPIVADLCRRLDGLPLAIELVAARVDLLGVRGLGEHLDDGVHRLTNWRHATPARHRTLQATLDWSYGLLSATEQLILRRFAVFAGGFDLASARAIAADTDVSTSDVLNGLLSLGAKSLLAADVRDGNVIYRLLDTTRAYAREKLRDSHENAEISRRHAAYLCDVWDGAETLTWSSAEWLEKHGRKIDDVRAAIDWCFSADGDAWLGRRLTAASGPLWFRLYLMSEYGRRLQRALQIHHAASTWDGALDMLLNVVLGYTLLYVGDPRSAAALDRAVELADRLGDTTALCEALSGLGYQHRLAGDYLSAVHASERAFLYIDGSSAEAEATGHKMMALSHHFAGRQATARFHAERALTRAIGGALPVGDRTHWLDHRITARAVLCRILWVQGFPDQAAIAAHDCVEDAVAAEHGLWLNSSLLFACTVALWTGDMPAADRFVAMLLHHAARHSLRISHFRARSLATVIACRRGKTRGMMARRDEMLSDPLCDPPYLETLATLSEDLVGAETVARAEDGRAGWCAAEILRANTAVMLRSGALDAASAETQFRRSLDIAREQGALSWELRTATSLARLWQDQDRISDAHDLLASVHGRFTEGFGTADLVTARTLLNKLVY
jgi:predicted ATPase/DNA-binding winged helix-turn-helix (wHTH) protein